MSTWQMIGSERAALADALDTLGPDAFDQPSLCGEWTVRDVLAHMTASAQMTPARFFGKLASSGFNFDKMVAGEVRALAAANTDEQLRAMWRSRVSTTNGPPGPSLAMLGEVIIHGEDIFRALGSYRNHPEEHLVAVADFYKGSNLIVGAKRRVAGLSLSATDASWKHGSGPSVEGPLVALILAMTGRRAALDDAAGDGVETLRSRS